MKLHTVFVTYNRLALTKRTMESYFATVTLPHSVWVVDNGSERETQDWLLLNDFEHGTTLLNTNRFPGYATNEGWSHAPADATHLHRSDNDVEYLPGWCDEVVERFTNERLWQLGLRTLEEEGPHAAVGGNCILHRAAWDQGIRYEGAPWTKVPFEDAGLSHAVYRAGYYWERVQKPCIEHIGIASRDDPYYQETFAVRGITFEQYGL